MVEKIFNMPDRETAKEDPFLVGVAISVYQNSGGPGTNWEAFEGTRNILGQPMIEGNDRCSKSSDFWNNYEADIARVAALNSNCFRLSLEWSRIEPHRGQLDAGGIARYNAIFDCLEKHKLEACVTLHHFAHPLWFEELGAFEKEENIPVFISFVETAFREFGRRARLWATFNEINVMSFCGYLYAHFPPAKLADFTLAGRHFLNMLKAHTAAYKAIKAMPEGGHAQVGLVHNFLQYRPKDPRGCSQVYLGPLCSLMERIWGNDLMVEYLTTGSFTWDLPFGKTIRHKEAKKPGCDWLGINYYGRIVLDWKFATTCMPKETMTDMPFPLYAPGVYEACKYMNAVGLPMYITETGVADHRDVLRPEMFETYFNQMERVVRDGYDLRGIMYWTLVDNWEWAHGFHKKFGLFRWSPGDGHKRGDVPSTALLAEIFADLPKRIQAIRAG